MKRNATTLKALAALVVGAACLVVSGTMADDSKSKKGGLFGLFKKKEDRRQDHAPPRPNVPAEAAGASVIASAGSTRVSDGVNRYPHIQGYETKFSKGQLQIEVLIDRIYEEFEQKIQGFKEHDQLLEWSSIITHRSKTNYPPGALGGHLSALLLC